MRTIKFRAWDAKYNQMLYGGERWGRYPNWYPVDYVTNKGVTIWNKRQANEPEHTWEFQRTKMNAEILIMQFAEMLDKNGKEIYEGDIVQTVRRTEYSGNDLVNEEVEFLGAAFYPICTEPSESWEVIGNKYENPELI